MQMAQYVDSLLADLAATAALGDEATAAVAEQLSHALRASAGLRLLDVLGEVALEVSAQLPSGHVEVRLTGQDPTLLYVEEEQQAAPVVPGDDAATARISLRLPESLKASVEAAAARQGVSVNTWLVRALSRGVSSPSPRAGNRLTGYARS